MKKVLAGVALCAFVACLMPCLVFAEGIDFGVASPGKWSVYEYSDHSTIRNLLSNAESSQSNCKSNAIYNHTQEKLVSNTGVQIKAGAKMFGCGNGKDYPDTFRIRGAISGKTYTIHNFDQKMKSGNYGIYIGE